MAVVFSNNATTVLSSNITNSATSIAVQDGSVFPTLSGTDYFYATLQDPGNTKREIVKVTARSGNTLTVTRAVDGSSASAFSANDAFELRLNAAALNDAVNSGTADLELNSFTGDGSEVDFTLSMEALEANTLVYIDGVYQNKTAYSISGYVLTFSAAPDNGAAIEVTTATVAPIQESTDFLLNQFTGDGSDTTFTLSSSPEENQTTVFISGVYQSKSNYSISGTTLTFSTAPPASSSIEVMVARTVVYGIGTPSNDTVSTAKIVDGAVTPAKLSLTYATETYVGTAVSNLVDSSPAALDTLNELAAALGDDPNFATTVTNSIALKAPLASPSFTGTATMDAATVQTTGSTTAVLTLNNADGNGTLSQINLGYTGDPDHGNIKYTGAMSFQTGGNQTALTLASNGNVNIPNGSLMVGATTAPSKGLHLNFSNDLASVRFENTANAKVWDLTPSIPNVANSGFSLHNVTDNTVPLHVDNSNNVGIGLTAPDAPLSVYSPSASANIKLTRAGTSENLQLGTYYINSTNNDLQLATTTSHPMVFKTNNTTRMTIDQYGGLVIKSVNGATTAGFYGGNLVNGITAVPTPAGTPFVLGRDTGTLRSAHFAGHLKFDSGYGVQFSVAGGSGTSTSGTLADYEEGTWTPALIAHAGTSPTITESNSGYYTKVGRLVTLIGELNVSAISGVTSGFINIANIPFTAWVGAGLYPVGNQTCSSFNWANPGNVTCTLYSNTRIGFLTSNNNAGWGWERFTAFSGNETMRFEITYYT